MSRAIPLHRRPLLAAIAAAAFARPVSAQGLWPSRPVRLIGGGAPGGPVDTVGRILGEALQEILGQPFFVESRPGGGGFIAAEAAARAAPDGYTLNICTIATHGIGPSLHRRLPIDPVRDFIHVARLVAFPNLIYANKDAPFRDLPGLIAYARANPGKLNHGSIGIGSSTQLAAVMLAQATGIEIVHVPFRGSAPMMTAVMAGDVQFAIDNLPGSLGQVQAGAVRPLAVTTAARAPELPDLPSVQEAGVADYDVSSWYGLQFPAGVQEAIVQRLSGAVAAVMRRPETRERFRRIGAQPAYLAPAAFDVFVKAEIARWRPVVQASGAVVE